MTPIWQAESGRTALDVAREFAGDFSPPRVVDVASFRITRWGQEKSSQVREFRFSLGGLNTYILAWREGDTWSVAESTPEPERNPPC